MKRIGFLAVLCFTAAVASGADAPKFTVLETKTISADAENYHGWPTLVRRTNGQMIVVCSGGREGHVCPFGRVDMYVSDDDGGTWTWPRTILDSELDDRDAGILETKNGTLLATTFTSLDYVQVLAIAEKKGTWPPAKLDRWLVARDRLPPDQRKAALGEWMIRSTDGGQTWSPRYATGVNSPHGPIQLAGGRLLYAGKQLWTSKKKMGVCESADDGLTWKWLADIPVRKGDTVYNYHELHAVECNSGRLIVHIRNHNERDQYETLQSESADGGKSWGEPHEIGVAGYPSHLLRLRNGKLLMSYGHRTAPYGNQARISSDEGCSWSAPMLISADGATSDLGYPSTVELADGSLFTVWYETLKTGPRAVLRAAHWKFE